MVHYCSSLLLFRDDHVTTPPSFFIIFLRLFAYKSTIYFWVAYIVNMDHPCGYWICRNSVNKRNAKSCGDSLNADLYPIYNEDV